MTYLYISALIVCILCASSHFGNDKFLVGVYTLAAVVNGIAFTSSILRREDRQ
jgi:hypothetical protein